MKFPSEQSAHRSSSQMLDETSSSSSSDSSDDEESSSSGEEINPTTQDSVSTPTGGYLHEPWLLQNREETKIPLANQQEVTQALQRPQSSDSSDGSEVNESDSCDEDHSSSDGLESHKKSSSRSFKQDLPEWESNPQIYGLRRSSRQKKEPERLNLKDEESDEDATYRSNTKQTLSDAPATLSGSSDEETSDYESSSNWKKSLKTNNRASKLTQMRAKLQGRKVKNLKARGSKPGLGSKSSKGRVRRATDSTVSDDDDIMSSDDNQPVRTSSRNLRRKNISYKENDSTQETDSDDVMEVAENYEAEEDPGTEAIEKIMDHRIGKVGATGGRTTVYATLKQGDPNEGFDKNADESETQYLIKWSGRSHMHNTWESEDSLKSQNARGMKRLENYIKRCEEINLWLRASSPEDREYYFCQQEMNKNVLGSYCKVDRIVARSRVKNVNDCWDYQVKWIGLPYSECTWEEETLLIKDSKAEIDAFDMRQDNPCVPNHDCKVLRQRPRFVPMTRQPDWFSGKLELRDYQLEGVNWLSHSWCKGNSVILADEMGLGKTIQSIVFLSYLYHTHELYGPFLVIVPLSTMTSWQSEFQTWAPFMNTIVYMGDQISRETIRNIEWTFPSKRYKFNAVLTSYEILLKDKSFLGSHSWAVIAVDEAHRLKNDDSLLYKSLIEFRSNHRLLITGTPLQNTLKELWALLHFIMPEKFGTWSEFEAEHAQNKDSGYASLHKVLQPFLLRRVKKDVEKSLPSKVEQILRIPMSSQQKQYYKWILTKNYKALTRGNRGTFGSFCNIVMELKKCCNHAYLVKPPEAESTNQESALGSLLRNSGKMVLLDKLLLRLKEDGHRVLIFSQMVRMLDIIQEYLISRRLQFQRLDGTVGSDLRRRALDHFNAEGSEDFCFLLSTRAGGLGINLATADTVIIFDSDWNPMNDLQAQARAHRIGQKNQVNIYRLVCAGSVEEDIIERAKKKMVLDHLVIQRMDTSGKTVLFKNSTPSSKANNPFNKDELTSILKFGAEELFTEADGDDKEPECDIDEILRRAETRQEQAGSSASDELLSAFKVATFNLDEEETADLGKDWNDIIPEKDRNKIDDEDRKKKEAELYLPRRARNKLKVAEGSDSDNGSGDSGSSEEDEEDGDAPRKRGRPARRPRGGEDHVRGFTTAEVRRFVRSFRKFGDPLSRLDAVARDAELSEQSEADLLRLGQKLYDKLIENKSQMDGSSQDPKDETTKQQGGRGRGPSFRIAGVSVSVKTTLACIEDLQPLVDVIPKNCDDRKSFRLSIPVRPIWKWDCSWDLDDDSKLLVGIYEYGMGSWEHIQSDPHLKLDKKILRPNNEKPQAKQLQSRSEYLIKLIKKAQDQNHPGITPLNPPPTGSNKGRRATPRDQDGKTKRSRKIKSKPHINDMGSDVNDDVAMTTSGQVETNDQSKNENGTLKVNDNESKKRGKRKRKAPEVGESPATSSKTNDAEPSGETKEKKRKRQSKETPSSGKSSKKGPIHITLDTSQSLSVAGEEFSGELDPNTFNDCKERLRPVKKALRQLDRPPHAPEGREEQVRAEHTRNCLLQIGDRVIQCLREYHDPALIKTLRRNLWIFVSKFTALDAEKLHKMYKHAIKRREQERKAKSDQSRSNEGHTETRKHSSEEKKKSFHSNSSASQKSRKVQHKLKKRSGSPPPQDGAKETTDVSPKPSKLETNESKTDRQTSGRQRPASPTRHFEEKSSRYPPPHNKGFEDRESWSRRHGGGRSPPAPDYRSRDSYMKPKRSPYSGDPRTAAPIPGRSPVYSSRDHEYREERHSRDYGPSPPHHHHPQDRYWRPREFRGSPPPPDYYPPPGSSRDWDPRYPPRGGYPSYHHAPRSPGRSPHAEFGHHRRRRADHYPGHGAEPSRGPRGQRYGGYADSPNANFSPPSSENSMDALRRSEKT